MSEEKTLEEIRNELKEIKEEVKGIRKEMRGLRMRYRGAHQGSQAIAVLLRGHMGCIAVDNNSHNTLWVSIHSDGEVNAVDTRLRAGARHWLNSGGPGDNLGNNYNKDLKE